VPSSNWPPPPELVNSPPSSVVRWPFPPLHIVSAPHSNAEFSPPAFTPPLHTVTVSLQFTFANAGFAALIVVVVTAAIMAAVVIAITKNLFFATTMIEFIHIY
jgi:hypothetical protein